MFKPEGIFTALVTPFRGGEIDEPALQELCERQIAAGVDGLVPCGSTGEAATLSHEEHVRVIQVVVKSVDKRVKVLAGSGSNSTSEAIALTKAAQTVGADGALLVSPYYNKPTPRGIVEHYAAVAQATGAEFPLVIYNNPKRTASNMPPQLVKDLSQIKSVVGIKEASGDLDQIAETISCTGADFAVLSGDDWATPYVMLCGGCGVISTASNLVPEKMVSMIRAWQNREFTNPESIEMNLKLLPLFRALFWESNPIPVKAALSFCGLIEDELRLPLTPLGEENRKKLHKLLREDFSEYLNPPLVNT